MNDLGMNLTGGGARGSYQAGVLLGLVEILKEQNLSGENNPFGYWSGTSAGAINATVCAANVDNLEDSVNKLVNLWTNLKADNVYLTDLRSVSGNASRWIRDLTFGSATKNKLARSLLDTQPLWNLLRNNIQFDKIEKQLNKGILKAVACSAYSYNDKRTVTFLQTHEQIHWDKPKRYSKKTQITLEQVMASCAIPILFPSIEIEKEYFADGGFRNTSPLSAVLQMGAKKIFTIGVRGPNELSDAKSTQEPGVAKIAGLILNALFFDTIDIDFERLGHINDLIESIHSDVKTKKSEYTMVNCFMIRPSRDVSKIAEDNVKNFPRVIKFLLSGLGSAQESSELASYILFSPEFTSTLVDLGYEDIWNKKNEVLKWLEA